MALGQPCIAGRTAEIESGLEVYDCDVTLSKVDILDLQSQGLTDAAAEVEEGSDKKYITEICRRFFDLLYFIRFKICLSHGLSNTLRGCLPPAFLV